MGKTALIVAAEGTGPTEVEALGALLEEGGFTTHTLDTGRDLAEQVEEIAASAGSGPILLYANGPAVTSDGTLFLCVDPADPNSADAVEDLVRAVADVARGPVTCLLELRLAAAQHREDPFAAAQIVTAARSAVRAAGNGVAAIACAFGAARRPTAPLAAAVTRIAASEAGTVDTSLLEVRLRDDATFVEDVQGFTTLAGAAPFEIRAPRGKPLAEKPEKPEPTSRATAPGVDVPRSPGIPLDLAEQLPPAETEAEPPVPAPEPPPKRPESIRAAAMVELPPERSFRLSDKPPPPGPRVVVRDSVGPPGGSTPPATGAQPAGSNPPSATPGVATNTFEEAMADGDRKREAGAFEEAVTQYKRALAMLPAGSASAESRARAHEHMGELRLRQGKRREAIAAIEKAAGLTPQPRPALLVKLLELNLEEGELRSVATLEDKLLALSSDAEKPLVGLVFARRWSAGAHTDLPRALALLQGAIERFGQIRKDGAASREEREARTELAAVLDALGKKDAAFAAREALAGILEPGHDRAVLLERLATDLLAKGDENGALPLFRSALEADPSHLAPLATVAKILADRQEWAELERAYRSAATRVEDLPASPERDAAAWELHRRLGLLLRDHLEDPQHALEAFEASLRFRADDEGTLRAAVEVARSLGEHARTRALLQLAARLDPRSTKTFHMLFETARKERDNDLAFCAAQVVVVRGEADARERIIFDEHDRPDPPRPSSALSPQHFEALEPPVDRVVEAIFDAITDPLLDAIHAELNVQEPDPAARIDPQQTTVFAVRSIAWAAHCVGLPAPHVYLDPEAPWGYRALLTAEPAVLLGSTVTKGRTLKELAFLSARHVAYHRGPRRLLLHLSTMDELSAAFLAAVGSVLGDVPVPRKLRAAEERLRGHLKAALADDPALAARLERAVRAFDASGSRTDLGKWVLAAERAATRLGLLFAGDLRVVGAVVQASRSSVRGEPLVVATEEEIADDLAAFVVSPEHQALRRALGTAIEEG